MSAGPQGQRCDGCYFWESGKEFGKCHHTAAGSEIRTTPNWWCEHFRVGDPPEQIVDQAQGLVFLMEIHNRLMQDLVGETGRLALALERISKRWCSAWDGTSTPDSEVIEP